MKKLILIALLALTACEPETIYEEVIVYQDKIVEKIVEVVVTETVVETVVETVYVEVNVNPCDFTLVYFPSSGFIDSVTSGATGTTINNGNTIPTEGITIYIPSGVILQYRQKGNSQWRIHNEFGFGTGVVDYDWRARSSALGCETGWIYFSDY